MNNNFFTEWQKEITDPVEVTKSTLKLARELYNNDKENTSEIDTIYSDIKYIHQVLTSALPYDYVSINIQITSKYEKLPNVGETSFIRVPIEFLQSQSDVEQKRVLALIAQSLQILMANIKINKVTNIVISNIIEHTLNAGVNAMFKSV